MGRLRPGLCLGFTLIELLVSIAIIGMLSAITLPAIQRVRHRARYIECANHMKQLGLAAHLHNHDQGRLPVGCTMPYARPASKPTIADTSGIPPPEILYDLTLTDSPARRNSDPIRYPFGPNWAVYLLPYIEQGNLYQLANVDQYMVGYKNGNDAQRDQWRAVLQNQKIKVYLCPADDGNSVPFQGYEGSPGPWARGNYAGNGGPGWWQMTLDGRSYDDLYGETGPVFGINFGAVIQKIADGASNTVMYTEVRQGVSAADARGVWALGYPGGSITAGNAIGDSPQPNDRAETADDVQGCPEVYYPGIGRRDRMGCNVGLLGLGWPSWQAQARSRHGHGVNVCMADGSVRLVSNTIAQATWYALLSANDGQTTHNPND